MPALTPLFVDTPTGAVAIPVTARDLRAAHSDTLQAGVAGRTHLKASASGLGVTVQPGTAYVSDGQTVPSLYRCEWAGSAPTVTIGAADASNPRLDQLVARVRDQNLDGGTTRAWELAILSGTAVAGATLDNRSGAASAQTRTLLLADILVPAGASSIPAANVRDRRPWSRGASVAIVGGQTSVADGNPISVSGTLVRVELSGAPLAIEVAGTIAGNSGSNGAEGTVQVLMDGAPQFSTGAAYCPRATVPYMLASIGHIEAPAAGSHTFSLSVFANLGSVYTGSGVNAVRYRIRELPLVGVSGNS